MVHIIKYLSLYVIIFHIIRGITSSQNCHLLCGFQILLAFIHWIWLIGVDQIYSLRFFLCEGCCCHCSWCEYVAGWLSSDICQLNLFPVLQIQQQTIWIKDWFAPGKILGGLLMPAEGRECFHGKLLTFKFWNFWCWRLKIQEIYNKYIHRLVYDK